jgi:hypothetical protein
LNTGSCAAAADLVFVDSVDGTDGINCGDGPDQAACATIGGVLGGLAKVTATRKYVVVSADAYTESILIDGLEVFLVATGAVNDPFFLVNQPALAVSGAAEVTVDGLTLQRASGVIGGVGLNCVGESTVRLHNAVVSENELGGLRANDCTIEIRASSIRGNEGFGVSINSGSATLLGSTIEQNERAGLVIEESPFAIENCFVVRNGSTFFAGSGGVQVKNSAAISSVAQVFTHNTVTQNESGVGVAGLQCNTVNAVAATSNLIHGNNPSSAPADADTSGNCAQSHSNVEGLTGGTGNLDMPPIFVAPQATVGNFHLAPGSPGIDVADPASTTSIDFDGDPRPVGAGFDMGADEVN